jgi:hypothetical protein
MKHRKRATVMALALAAASFGVTGTASADPPDDKAAIHKVQKWTKKYLQVKNARADGFRLVGECVPGMGYHFVKAKRVDRWFVPPEPEALVYAPSRKGLELAAVEYIVLDRDDDLHTGRDRPKLFGHYWFDGPMLGHEPSMPVHYDLHVWAWLKNPYGDFATHNPRVKCPRSK